MADTAEDLMRSRYTAHVVEEWDYLVNTRRSGERKDLQDLATANAGVEWKKLEVWHSHKGGQADEEGEVTYSATFEKDGKTGRPNLLSAPGPRSGAMTLALAGAAKSIKSVAGSEWIPGGCFLKGGCDEYG